MICESATGERYNRVIFSTKRLGRHTCRATCSDSCQGVHESENIAVFSYKNYTYNDETTIMQNTNGKIKPYECNKYYSKFVRKPRK